MDKLKQCAIFYCILILNFYGIPCLMKDTGSAMIIMLVVIPMICFITSIGYGIKNGFHFWYALGVAVIFIPSIFIFYNSTAWVYIIAYGMIALLGNLIALPFYKKLLLKKDGASNSLKNPIGNK